MIQFQCPHCTKEIRAADEHIGKKIRCPKCREVLTVPGDTAVKPAAPSKPPPSKAAPSKAAPIQKGPPPRRPAPADDDDVPIIEASDDDDEEYERKRRKRKKRRLRRQGAYADCPNCDAPGDAQRVAFTWWGGLVGPAILTHVRCNECGSCYNGRTGKSNNLAIAIYIGVGVLFGLVAVALAVIFAILKPH